MKTFSTVAVVLVLICAHKSVFAQSPNDPAPNDPAPNDPAPNDPAPNDPAPNDPNTKSIQQLFHEAEELSQNAEKAAEAIQKYRELIAQHRKNEKQFNQVLRQLTRQLEDADRQEESIELLRELYSDQAVKVRYEFLNQTLQKYQKKYPDLIARLQEQARAKQKEQATPPQIMPSKSLLDSILQRSDKTLREESLAKLKEMLAPEATNDAKLRGLSTLVKALPAKFDHKAFYSLVVPLLDSEDSSIRLLALSCLPHLGGTANDLAKVARMSDDESIHVRKQVGASLVGIGNGQHADLVIPTLVKLMEDSEDDVVKRTIRSMWGQYTSPEYDRFLVDLSYDGTYEHIVIYHCLSTMRPKSEVVCGRLIEVLDDPDRNHSGRAAWGLTYGVSPEAQNLVERGLLNALPEETNEYTRKQEFTALKHVATEDSREYLEAVIASDLEADHFKKLAQEVLATLQK